MIRNVYPGSGIRIRIPDPNLDFFIHPGSWIQGTKRHGSRIWIRKLLVRINKPRSDLSSFNKIQEEGKAFLFAVQQEGGRRGGSQSTLVTDPVFRIRDIFVRIRILVSVPLHNGSGRPKNVRILRIRNTGRRRIYS